MILALKQWMYIVYRHFLRDFEGKVPGTAMKGCVRAITIFFYLVQVASLRWLKSRSKGWKQEF